MGFKIRDLMVNVLPGTSPLEEGHPLGIHAAAPCAASQAPACTGASHAPPCQSGSKCPDDTQPPRCPNNTHHPCQGPSHHPCDDGTERPEGCPDDTRIVRGQAEAADRRSMANLAVLREQLRQALETAPPR
ncbi:MAG: hypothetical protein M3O15_16490 [Acidobacteriota bacterium]|nr:hypothetical protein [Acidobacteriota bacterium]